MRTVDSEEHYRNFGFWNEPTQRSLCSLTVGIAGNGGTGNAVGIALAQMGVQRFVLADPEPFDRVNMNRVQGARESTLGRNKAEVLKEDIIAINPDAQIDVYPEGVNPDNIEEFFSRRRVDVVLNGLELTRPELGTMLARQARRAYRVGDEIKGIPLIAVEYIGYAGQGYVIDPKSKMTFERLMGIKGGELAPLDEIAEQAISPDRYLAYLPPYGDLTTLQAIKDGAPLPSNAIGAGVAADIAKAEVLKLARLRVGEKTLDPTWAPRVRWYDAYTGRSGQTLHPRLSYYRHLVSVAALSMFGANEPASYTTKAREARGDIE